MLGYKKELGKFGEKLAADFLRQKGYQIIDKNYYTDFGEIDLIAQTGDELLFVEVKTRTSEEFGYPEQAVDYYKIKHLVKAINLYLNREKIERFWRLDVLSVILDKTKKTARIRWFRDVSAQ